MTAGLNQELDLVIASEAVAPMTADRALLSNPYSCSGGVILTQVSGPRNNRDLADENVCFQTGSVAFNSRRILIIDKKLVIYAAGKDAIIFLLRKSADAVITDTFAALTMISSTLKAKLQQSCRLCTDSRSLVTSKRGAALVSQLNTGLDRLLLTCTYIRSSSKYFG